MLLIRTHMCTPTAGLVNGNATAFVVGRAGVRKYEVVVVDVLVLVLVGSSIGTRVVVALLASISYCW